MAEVFLTNAIFQRRVFVDSYRLALPEFNERFSTVESTLA